MDKVMSLSEARDHWADVIGRVQFGGERVTIAKRGKPVAVVVSVEDAAWLEAMEDRIDVELAREALAEMERMGGKTYSNEEVFAGLDDSDEPVERG